MVVIIVILLDSIVNVWFVTWFVTWFDSDVPLLKRTARFHSIVAPISLHSFLVNVTFRTNNNQCLYLRSWRRRHEPLKCAGIWS